MKKPVIRFRHNDLKLIHGHLFADPDKEAFALLLAKKQVIGRVTNITVHDVIFPGSEDYLARSLTHLDLEKTFIHQALKEVTTRFDIDTIIDVHSHPFGSTSVQFSGTDDKDEKVFAEFLKSDFDDVFYGSIVFSKAAVRARLWTQGETEPQPVPVLVKTQTSLEISTIKDEESTTAANDTMDLIQGKDAIYNRSMLALGRETMEAIITDSCVTIVGVGGIGSVMAEHLVHMGFLNINLIDYDILELSNMNRIVGATYSQAEQGVRKVDAISQHLKNINPDVFVTTCPEPVETDAAKELIAASDWVLLATDSHSSRLVTQQVASNHFVPLISAGVNITVTDKKIEDMSGEVITVRAGDACCLRCLGRINQAVVAYETHPDMNLRKKIADRGYVTGHQVKEPAVKTLNTMLATMAVDTLVDQYHDAEKHNTILVYENTGSKRIYPDNDSLDQFQTRCSLCNV